MNDIAAGCQERDRGFKHKQEHEATAPHTETHAKQQQEHQHTRKNRVPCGWQDNSLKYDTPERIELMHSRRNTIKDTLVEWMAGSAAAPPNKSARERKVERIGMVAPVLHRTDESAIQTAKAITLRERWRRRGKASQAK